MQWSTVRSSSKREHRWVVARAALTIQSGSDVDAHVWAGSRFTKARQPCQVYRAIIDELGVMDQAKREVNDILKPTHRAKGV